MAPMMAGYPLLFVLIISLLLAALPSLSASLYKPPAALPANAFVGGNESWFVFPEISPCSNYSIPSIISRPSFGIALSGGGMRVATVGLGFLRGLHQVAVATTQSPLDL